MQKVLTAAQMREVDRLTTEKYGIPSILLMENAAHAVARVITEKLGGSVKGKSILILCGPGNNGADGAALARILWIQGGQPYVFTIGSRKNLKDDARTNFEILSHFNGYFAITSLTRENLLDQFQKVSDQRPDAIVDAVFGTGLNRPLSVEHSSLLELVRDYTFDTKPTPVFAIDIPSGLNSDGTEPTTCPLKADVTITFTAPKPALVLPPTCHLCGELITAPIGTPGGLVASYPSQLFVTTDSDLGLWCYDSRFTDSSYKNKRGHALLISGSESYSGAAVLCGNAAMRSGVGLVTIATPKSSKDLVASRVLPEVMVRGVDETKKGSISEKAFDEIGDLLEKADSVAIGSGISQDESTKKFVQKVIENRRQPTIVDADALNLLSPFAGFVANGESKYPLIVTPHEGEFMRLLGTTDKDVLKDRVAAVREFATKNNVILVLKGERVLIGDPSGKVVVNPTGNSGLGKAGNGDTLTGILAGFVAQAVQFNIDIFETVVAAVYVAGMAGDIAEKKYGKRVMTASDVRECLAETFEQLAGN